MLFSIFLTLLFLSIIFMILGYFINMPFVSLLGALMLLGLGLTVLGVNVELKSGDVTTIGYNGTTATNLTTSYNYEAYDFGTLGQSSYGFILTILGAFLFVMFIFGSGD